MRFSDSVYSRTFFLLVSLVCCARGAQARALDGPPRRIARRKQNTEMLEIQSQSEAASGGDFSISANPIALTIPVNASPPTSFADGTITLTGLNGFSGNVGLTCNVTGGSGQNLPSCLFPALVINELFVDASNSPSTTTIEAAGAAGMCNPPEFCAVPRIFVGGSGIFAAAGLALVLVGFSIGFAGPLTKKLRAQIMCAAMICGAGLVTAGCRNGPAGDIADGCPPGLAFTPGTPAGTYTLTVVGTNGNLSHSVTISVTVPAQ